ncbi:50S ribosomal protein L3 [Candidatus Nomurabacteria bacterium]|nr:50S ribosomal protein L3 [Candidatus Nomurabacteria bacterium]
MKFILGKKMNMTQLFLENGEVKPVTTVLVKPMTVTQVKTKEKDGYSAVQVGFNETLEKRINKAQKGHAKGLGNFADYREFAGSSDLKVGDKIDLSSFNEGDTVVASSISKGKGFQGVVKRHGFKGGPRSHGQKHSEREPGSISGGARGGGRVPKGMRMAGRMGGTLITVKNLKIVQIDKTNGMLYISGAIPGRRGTVVEIKG